jgi:hypothetical protein
MSRARMINRIVWRHVWTFCLLVMVVTGTGTMTAAKDPSWLDVVWAITGPVLGLWWAIARIATDVIATASMRRALKLRRSMMIRLREEDGSSG